MISVYELHRCLTYKGSTQEEAELESVRARSAQLEERLNQDFNGHCLWLYATGHCSVLSELGQNISEIVTKWESMGATSRANLMQDHAMTCRFCKSGWYLPKAGSGFAGGGSF